jgi:hypothetical protein
VRRWKDSSVGSTNQTWRPREGQDQFCRSQIRNRQSRPVVTRQSSSRFSTFFNAAFLAVATQLCFIQRIRRREEPTAAIRSSVGLLSCLLRSRTFFLSYFARSYVGQIGKETDYSHVSIRIRPSWLTIANFLFPRGFQGARQILSWQNTAPLGGWK